MVPEIELLIEDGTPDWKANFQRKNSEFYTKHHDVLDPWLAEWDYLVDFPPSRRKFEWQAQHARSLDETVMHLRPSGLRAKRATYVPALVAIRRQASRVTDGVDCLRARSRGCRGYRIRSSSVISLLRPPISRLETV